ncbi:MAG TPA: glycosyltransferase N-terminal domain-containing protein [Ferruginibacter sp.]|nr:glycosyltransferase N-terminal domain-containing protein [Ferruginibacter sp.]
MPGKFLYNLFLLLYSTGIRVAAAWNPKAKKWLAGRKDIFARINDQRSTTNDQPVWMHCASLGEFEQGRPLLEELRMKNEELKIVLTFFSPSGYEVMKDYKGADHIFYLPMDSSFNAKKFLDAVDPCLVLWVKYEYWFYYLQEIKERNIPLLLVSGIFRQNQPFFKWYGGIWKQMLRSFTHFFVQNEESKQLLAQLGFSNNVSINGDTRFDRVIEIAEKHQPVPFIEEFCGDSMVMVAGSTWEEDEIELLHFVKQHPQIKFIIAPHEIDAENLKDVKQQFINSVFYSELLQTSNLQPILSVAEGQTSNILIIDNVGMLARLYKYAHITYVGGGFGEDGVHNVLEAAVYGKPVVFGPVYEKFIEASGLVDAGGGISADGLIKLEDILNKLATDEKERVKRGEASKKYVYENAGASKKIIQFIQENRLLTR